MASNMFTQETRTAYALCQTRHGLAAQQRAHANGAPCYVFNVVSFAKFKDLVRNCCAQALRASLEGYPGNPGTPIYPEPTFCPAPLKTLVELRTSTCTGTYQCRGHAWYTKQTALQIKFGRHSPECESTFTSRTNCIELRTQSQMWSAQGSGESMGIYFHNNAFLRRCKSVSTIPKRASAHSLRGMLRANNRREGGGGTARNTGRGRGTAASP
jgi:hypothetical protein